MPLQIRNLYKSFSTLKIFKNFNMTIHKNKINCILGPSGCGKTTLLNIIAGLESIDSGALVGFENKSLSFIFQEPRLLEWMTVWDNIDFVLKDIFPKQKRQYIITNYLKTVDLLEFKNYYPKELSGGMKQRVSIARAFAYPSDILIMDEPFKGLDNKLKNTLIKSFLRLWLDDKRTIIFVTHDIDESLLLGDDIFILSKNPAHIKKHITIDIAQKNRNIEKESLISIKNILINSF
ncbi:aliphatic sulfonates import ATP-binding protein SsuB [Clostridium tepidiprofundi DSM 19306]|uniref:Aliphatic sulfonates import ATP-binding protein SsuB n=1 Tax=Clostridium tepidiprofundi DSM 19306 TaxID=1121338 RepID=A0A151B2I1_9CLOT|nr:ABC transporter ATP-binding protein [Clostridium tepidiprofundi]KYH34139.1 aliphatic sulfonates import ATP-binding protein SsuB [Clostridium tepidiprofundi DSM 19306]